MIYVGIDVAKDKHDCFITNSDGEVLFKSFTISNNREGFETLFQRIESVSEDLSKVKVGLEATRHYSYNLLGFLLDKGLPTYVINPLHTNLYRKSLSLRKTKTDQVDPHTIASMIMSDVNLKPYLDTSYHNEELFHGHYGLQRLPGLDKQSGRFPVYGCTDLPSCLFPLPDRER